jgi:hypothetical protein
VQDFDLAATALTLLLEGNKVRLDAAHFVAHEGKDIAESEAVNFAALVGTLAIPDCHHGIALFDQAIDGQRWTTDKFFILDLPIKRLLTLEISVTRKIPDDVVCQAGEDPLVIAAAKPLEIAFDDFFTSRHVAFSIVVTSTIPLVLQSSIAW